MRGISIPGIRPSGSFVNSELSTGARTSPSVASRLVSSRGPLLLLLSTNSFTHRLDSLLCPRGSNSIRTVERAIALLLANASRCVAFRFGLHVPSAAQLIFGSSPRLTLYGVSNVRTTCSAVAGASLVACYSFSCTGLLVVQ